MCLILDDREDSTLGRYLQVYDVPSSYVRLDFGDAMWEGKGPKGPVMVGVERKHLADLASSMTDRRLSGHQLRGMFNTFDYCYLVVEDNWRPDESGGIETFQRGQWRPLYSSSGHGINYRQIDSYLSSLELKGGLIVCRTGSMRETAALYASRYYWWAKPWADHHAHDEIYCPGPDAQHRRGKAHIFTKEPGLVEKVAAQLPGIDRKAWDVGRRFKSVRELVNATEKDWMTIPGVGPTIARAAVRQLKGE